MTSSARRTSRACRVATLGFAVLTACALGLFAIGSLGLFGSARDPLAGVFLLPLGLPWNRMIDGVPDALRPWLAAAAPLLNLLIMWAGCKGLTARPSNDISRLHQAQKQSREGDESQKGPFET